MAGDAAGVDPTQVEMEDREKGLRLIGFQMRSCPSLHQVISNE